MTRILSARAATLSALGALALSPPLAAEAQDSSLPVVGPVTRESWIFETSYLTPRGDFQDAIRDLEAISVTAMRSWEFASGIEAQLGGGLFSANGSTTELFSPDPPRESDATGLRAGGRVRYNFPEVGAVRPFVDAYAGVLWTPGQPFPAGGSGVNGVYEWGGGIETSLSDTWSVAAGWRNNHISNGGGLVAHNPAWDSEGAFVSVRRKIGRGAADAS